MSDTAVKLNMKWDLDSIFPGGSGSTEYKEFRDKLKQDLAAASKSFAVLPDKLDDSSRAQYKIAILEFQRLSENLGLVYSLALCLTAQDVDDKPALQILQETDVLISEWRNLETRLESLARKQDDASWIALLEDSSLSTIKFSLTELRDNAKHKMAEEYESFANELAVNGFHAWNRLYDKMSGDLRVEFTENGKAETVSLGQLASKMDSPDRSIRQQALEKLEEAWETRADYAAMCLNSLGGFRLSIYKHRNWESPLYEPLVMGRLKEDTLNAMWSAVANGVPKLVPYIEAKKKLLGMDKFMWYDQTAAVGKSESKMTYDDAHDFIIKHLSGFSDEMSEFSQMAFEKRWIEAENRTGKAGGGFCTGFGPKKQSRIFMTYLDTFGDMSTLAHELGHAYHSWVLKDKPPFAREYPANLAETASIFNELLVTDAAFKVAAGADEQLMLLDQKLQRAQVLFCNLYARFLFDKAFYAERKNGVISRQRLDELMVQSQKEAFGDTLDPDGCHPLFWASKLHFYLTGLPFYNFPYTFGFLFAGGVYDRAQKEGKAFASKYRDLLLDTGSMTTEDLGRKHLGVDLAKPDFWNDAVNRVLEDVEPFVKLVG
ncbi:MAG: M3 family oligoendopeptidase [Candidatus Zixiibacteriota bacterium]